MTPPDSGRPGHPFQSLLGDLINMLGSGGPDQWELTQDVRCDVATGGTAEANVEPIQRIQVEQLSRVAELNVIEATGMPVTPDGRRLSCVPVGRGDWTVRALESWRPIRLRLPPLAPWTGPPPPRRPPDVSGDDPAAGMAAMLGQWATAVGPMFAGLQIGSVPRPPGPAHARAVPARRAVGAVGRAPPGDIGLQRRGSAKRDVIPFLDKVTPLAKRMDANNTVWREDGKWRGTNTDGAGVVEPLKRLLDLTKLTVLMAAMAARRGEEPLRWPMPGPSGDRWAQP